MTVGEAVDRALAIHAEIVKREPNLPGHIVAALVVAATNYQTLDWLEDKLERIVQHLPES